MSLLADRFLPIAHERAVDLATGLPVLVRLEATGDRQQQIRWALRCDDWQKLHHRAFAPLLDYGATGQSLRFEAWLCGAPWNGAVHDSRRAVNLARQFLEASSLTCADEGPGEVHRSAIGPVVVPAASTGYATDRAGGQRVRLEACGVATVESPVVAHVAEILGEMSGHQPRVVNVYGPCDSGRSVLARMVARAARLQGFVPVAVPMLSRLGTSPPRSLCVIARASDGWIWTRIVHAAGIWPRPHVIVVINDGEIDAIDNLRLARVPAHVLVAAVRPLDIAPDLRAEVGRAARQSAGLPGRFVRLLWHAAGAPSSSVEPGVRAAESRAVYSVDVPHARATTAVVEHAWPLAAELTALRERLATATALVASGRHASGERCLRQIAGAASRRRAWPEAADASAALALALVRRGRPSDARAVIADARHACEEAGNGSLLMRLSILDAEAWIDLARLGEAEAVASAVLVAARVAGDLSLVEDASITLARVLFWSGRYSEADATLQAGCRDAPADPVGVRAMALRARVAVGRRDFSAASAWSVDAARRAVSVGDRGRAVAGAAAALVHLGIGDAERAAQDAAGALVAARASHDMLRQLDARLLLAEAHRRLGRPSAATDLVRRLRRLGSPRVPPLVRARLDLLDLLGAASDRSHQTIARLAAATNLPALILYAPLPDRAGGFRSNDSVVDDALEVLQSCQEAEDERTTLTRVCAQLRRRLRAASVGLIVARPGASGGDVLVADGARIDPDVAVRAAELRLAIAPHRVNDGIESAAPIVFGGSVIAVLAARWTLGHCDDVSRAASALTVAAAAVAGVAAALLAERRIHRTDHELLGMTPGISEVRRTIERAGRSPFPVLIDGESGSGKELVARALHRESPRRDRSFCTINCAALPDELLEAELFGHARGAFTGAITDRQGVFQEAHGGTLLLDEIGELSPRAQAKVLRVLQEGELRRVGENVSRRVDVRVVAATNRDLRAEAAAGRFRVDLLYRLDVIRISVPPLRDRREDVPVLVDHYWRAAAERVGSRAVLAPATIAALARYDWPGNVRELQNVLASLAVRSPRRGLVPPTALPAVFAGAGGREPARLDEARRTFDERFVRAALVRSGGHRGRTAAELGVTRQGLTKLMTRLGIAG